MSKSNLKTTDSFKQTVLNELTKMAANDPLFAASFQKENKNIDDCINYVLKNVMESGINGFTDAEVFGIACHYYDEDDIGTPAEVQCKVIVNHTIELTAEEIQDAKREARETVLDEEMKRLRKQSVVTKKSENANLTFEF
jgi:hypothetical protein